MNIEDMHDKHREKYYNELPWKAWGSWFSWGSPVGFGLFVVAIGVFLWLLHLAHIIHP
ncbi:MAG TPA: hypothetical protein VG621_01710 [Candidatus Paceibacterota bacterium]|nr:hypothetical protein [Candidatus Paceibacterota bacterium]